MSDKFRPGRKGYDRKKKKDHSKKAHNAFPYKRKDFKDGAEEDWAAKKFKFNYQIELNRT